MTLARAVVLVAVAVPLAARAGVVIEGKGRNEETTRFVMDGQKLRMDTRAQQSILFDGAAKKMTQIDRAKGVYTEFTQADMDAMNAMVRQAQEQHGAPKDAGKPPSIRYEKTGKSDSALGKSCDVYRTVREHQTHASEICVAPFGTFGVDKPDFAPFRAFAEFASQIGGGRRGGEQTWADIPGVPLVGWDVEDGKRTETFRATKIQKASVPASEFTVPAGLKQGPNVAEQMKQAQQKMMGGMPKGPKQPAP